MSASRHTEKLRTRLRRRATVIMGLLFGLTVLGASTYGVGTIARDYFLYPKEEDIVPIIAGSELDDVPRLLRGNRRPASFATTYGQPMRDKPPRLCEMPDDYFETLDRPAELTPGYTRRNAYVRRYRDRRGRLTEREMASARAAWNYFEKFTQEATGLANSVGNYPSTTLWDTASYISGAVAAYELCLIEKPEFDERIFKLLTTFRSLVLFRGELPNKVYHTRTGEKVDYTNKSGEIGFSALDIGRFLVWLRILKNRYPYFGNSIDAVLLKWDFANAVSEEGLLYGAAIDKETGDTLYAQEGRLGYEEYAAKGFALWGFDVSLAHRAEPFFTTSINGVLVPYDGRDPRVFHSQNYVVTESYLQDGLELGFDLPQDDVSPPWLHTDGWRAEFADRIYQVQENRYYKEGFMTARSEHNVKGAPYFVYDSIFSDGYAWNTVTPRGDFSPDHSAVASKAAIGLWALWDTPYTDILGQAILDLYHEENGFYEGLYERGQGIIEIHTANNNGIILAALLYKVQGPILTGNTHESEVWYTAFRDRDIRIRRGYPDPIRQEGWLPALRHVSVEESYQ